MRLRWHHFGLVDDRDPEAEGHEDAIERIRLPLRNALHDMEAP